ncbi:MAG TPA: ABC transporter ATP-binding protein [Syntrophorhabdales bacterium]|nr:ABC transporter ATP-binding protein [Syntrophorhabdales bacterium]
MLEVRDIHTYYGNSYILQGVSLKVDEGSIVGILGRNGVGKTTLISSIMGFTSPRRGQVIFKGTDITNLPSHRIARMGIGLVPQGRRVFKSLNVRENLTVAAMDRGKGWSLSRIYGLFPVLGKRERQKAGRLSGGEQQMLATARGIRNEPDLLLMDEPSEGLAPLMVQELGRTISQLKAEGFSCLLVEQNLALALRVADYICVMSKGTIVYRSTPEELLRNEEVKSQYLGV